MLNIAVYTAIFGGYDQLREPPPELRCDFVCFTDDPGLRSNRYSIRYCPDIEQSAVKEARRRKALSHQFLPEYDFTVWVDGTAEFLFHDIEQFLAEHLQEADIAVHEHPENDDIYAEFERCVLHTRDDPEVMKQQIERYRREGYPPRTGLIASGVILRANRSENVRRFNEAWWNEIRRFSYRDQLSFNYVAWREEIPFRTFAKMYADPDGFHSRFFRFNYAHRISLLNR